MVRIFSLIVFSYEVKRKTKLPFSFSERADEERREKEAQLKLKKKQFRDLLRECNVSIK